MPVIPLAPLLADLLKGHLVEAILRDDMVYVPQLDRWADLWMHQTEGGAYLLEVSATASHEVMVADRCAGIGDTAESAGKDALRSFCSGSFHVLLAALWGVLERDQIDHEIRLVAQRHWDLYLGPCTLRCSAGVEPLVLPQNLPDLVLKQLELTLKDSRVHTARLYLGVLNGAVTVEALIDDQPDAALTEVFRCSDWVLPETGFASLRWFLAACPRTNGPSHSVERSTCPG